jgi:hypothetical protein
MTLLVYSNPYVELLFWTIELVISYCQMVHLFMHLPIPNFKSWVKGCLKDGLEILVGHTNMHFYLFLVDSVGWPIM